MVTMTTALLPRVLRAFAIIVGTAAAGRGHSCPHDNNVNMCVPNPAGVLVFKHSEDGYNCTRIPSVILGHGGVLLAFAEGRKWVGDGCHPHGSASPPKLPPGRGTKHPDAQYTDVVLKRSTDSGRTWSKRAVVALGGWCPSAVWDAKRKTVIVQFSRVSDDALRQLTSSGKPRKSPRHR